VFDLAEWSFFPIGEEDYFFPECAVKSHYHFRIGMFFISNGIGGGFCKNMDVQVWLWKKLR